MEVSFQGPYNRQGRFFDGVWIRINRVSDLVLWSLCQVVLEADEEF